MKNELALSCSLAFSFFPSLCLYTLFLNISASHSFSPGLGTSHSLISAISSCACVKTAESVLNVNAHITLLTRHVKCSVGWSHLGFASKLWLKYLNVPCSQKEAFCVCLGFSRVCSVQLWESAQISPFSYHEPPDNLTFSHLCVRWRLRS